MAYFKGNQMKFLILLGIPATGISLTYTLVTSYMPYFLERLSNATIAGLIISLESFFALLVPILVGLWSDAITTRLGKRLPFFLAGVLICCSSVVLMPFSIERLSFLIVELTVFFFSYFVLYQAYYSLYPDLVSQDKRGSSQGILAGFKAVGMLIALTLSGLLITIWLPLPFILFSAVLILLSAHLCYSVRNEIKREPQATSGLDWKGALNFLKKNREIRLWLIANTLWDAAIATLRVFFILYFAKGLKLSFHQSSLALAMIGIGAIIAAPLSGFFADKYGHKPVVLTATFLFTIGLLPPIFSINKYFLIAIIPVAFAAVILMALPFSMLMAYLPENKQHGIGSALFLFCQGLGVFIGPSITGFAIDHLRHFNFLVFQKTSGYSAMFVAAVFFLILSIPLTAFLFKKKA